jgi:arylsulfatase A-like enzyme
MYRLLIIVITLICGFTTLNSWAKEIIHDGEFNYLKAQHGEQWAAEDKDIESKLAAIRAKNGGKRPNILYILVDDVGFGDFGMPGLNYVRGTQTPHINTLATEGVSLMRMYTEPSCTPTRVAFMTGRHPIRSGMGEVKVALVGEGLSENEVTIAEILSKAGYNTAHIGKWHMGDIEQAFPHNQGFDFAAFPVHQQVQLSLMTAEGDHATQLSGWYEGGNTDRFAIDERFKPYGLVTALEGKKGGKAREVDMQAGEEWTQKKYSDMHERYQRQTLEQLRVLSAKDDPFFIQYWPLIPLNFVRSDREQFNTANGGTAVESMQQLDGYVGEILAEVDKLGIADNTLVVLMADNGPFLFGYQSVLGMSDMVYRGGKTDTTEGGIRVNAFMRWPGVIEQGSFAGDMFHASDLFSTFAHLGDATKYIPTDRIIDGIDQTALLLNGETHGRRDYVYVYGGFNLAAVVKQKFKMHLPPPGVPGAAAPVYDLMRDPREEKSLITAALWSGASFQDMVKRHKISMKQYPNLPIGTDKPYGGIENLRPETKATVENFMSWH